MASIIACGVVGGTATIVYLRRRLKQAEEKLAQAEEKLSAVELTMSAHHEQMQRNHVKAIQQQKEAHEADVAAITIGRQLSKALTIRRMASIGEAAPPQIEPPPSKDEDAAYAAPLPPSRAPTLLLPSRDASASKWSGLLACQAAVRISRQSTGHSVLEQMLDASSTAPSSTRRSSAASCIAADFGGGESTCGGGGDVECAPINLDDAAKAEELYERYSQLYESSSTKKAGGGGGGGGGDGGEAAALPIECLVNFVLLMLGARRVIQFDMGFYSDPKVAQKIRLLVDEETSGLGSMDEDDAVVSSFMGSGGDIILCKQDDLELVEAAIEEAGGVGSIGFARLLDPAFYSPEASVANVYEHPNLSQVSINVIRSARNSGALLVQMLCTHEVDEALPAMYGRFAHYKNLLATLDPELQVTFRVYCKAGAWKEQMTCLEGQRSFSPAKKAAAAAGRGGGGGGGGGAQPVPWARRDSVVKSLAAFAQDTSSHSPQAAGVRRVQTAPA